MAQAQALRFGLFVAQNRPWDEFLARCRHAEVLGFESLWIGDDLWGVAVRERNPIPGLWYEAWTLLGAIALTTSVIRIGTLVSSITFRNPVLLAKQAITVDHLSKGRLELGIGTGGLPQDLATEAIDWSPRVRVRRLREVAEILDAFLRNEATTYHGRFYEVSGAARVVAPVQQPRPPLTIAAHGPEALRVAARYADRWNCERWLTPAESAAGLRPSEAIARRVSLLDEEAAACGRLPSSIVHSLTGSEPDAFDSRDAFAEFVRRYSEMGITEFIFLDEGLRSRGVLETVASDWIPAVR